MLMIENDELKAIGARIRQIRKDLGLYQEELARKLDISTPTLAEAEKGNTKPGFDILYGLTKIFNINLNYLLFGEGEVQKKTETPQEKIDLGDFNADFKYVLSYLQQSRFYRAYLITHAKEYLIENKESVLKDIDYSARVDEVTQEDATRLTPIPNMDGDNKKEK